ncbi:Hypothetical predicted protein, partial [Paramuricea clavata]
MDQRKCIVHYDIKDTKYSSIKELSSVNKEKIYSAKCIRESLGDAINSHTIINDREHLLMQAAECLREDILDHAQTIPRQKAEKADCIAKENQLRSRDFAIRKIRVAHYRAIQQRKKTVSAFIVDMMIHTKRFHLSQPKETHETIIANKQKEESQHYSYIRKEQTK